MSEKNGDLKRSLKARHLNMIALGGAIGTGIFLALGDTIQLLALLLDGTIGTTGQSLLQLKW